MQLCILFQAIIIMGKRMSDEKVIAGQLMEDSSLLMLLKIKKKSAAGCRLSFAPQLAHPAHPTSVCMYVSIYMTSISRWTG